jgi:hypothetical protein
MAAAMLWLVVVPSVFSQESIVTVPRRAIIQGFADKYQIVQKPRIVIYINRNHIPSALSTVEADKESLPSAEARIIDEHFAASFFEAGVRFVDEDLAASLQRAYDTMGNFLQSLTRSQDRAHIEFIRKNADIAIELRVQKKETEFDPKKQSPYQIKATAYDLRLPGTILARVGTDEIEVKASASVRRSGTSKTPLQEEVDQLSLLLMQRLIPAMHVPEG